MKKAGGGPAFLSVLKRVAYFFISSFLASFFGAAFLSLFFISPLFEASFFGAAFLSLLAFFSVFFSSFICAPACDAAKAETLTAANIAATITESSLFIFPSPLVFETRVNAMDRHTRNGRTRSGRGG